MGRGFAISPLATPGEKPLLIPSARPSVFSLTSECWLHIEVGHLPAPVSYWKPGAMGPSPSNGHRTFPGQYP